MGPVWLRRVGNIMVGFNERNTRNRRGKISDQRPRAHVVFLPAETAVTPGRPFTGFGVDWSFPIIVPSCPASLTPQHSTVDVSFKTAHA